MFLPTALANGIDYATFWHLTPKTLWKVIEEKQKIADENAWNLGQYFMHSIGACFSKGSHYPEQPFTQKQEVVSETENTTQEDSEKRKEMQLKLLFARLDVMGMNANLERERKELKKKKLEEQGEEPTEIDMENFEPYDLGEG